MQVVMDVTKLFFEEEFGKSYYTEITAQLESKRSFDAVERRHQTRINANKSR